MNNKESHLQELKNSQRLVQEYTFNSWQPVYTVQTFYLCGMGEFADERFETRINFDNQIVKKTITYSEMDALEAHLEYVKQELNNPRLDLSFGIRRLF